MTRQNVLRLSATGTDVPALFHAIADEPSLELTGDTATWTIDGTKRVLGAQWRSEAAQATRSASSFLGHTDGNHAMVIQAGSCVAITTPWTIDAGALCALLARLPFTLASVGTLYPAWELEPALAVPNKALGYGLGPYGSFVAFKGAAGHALLVSRRWATHGGPWITHTGPDDVTLLQLHDLDADSAVAREQLLRVQPRLGPAATGGYFPPGFKRTLTVGLQYSGRDKKASIVVAKREVSPREMLEAASLRGSDVAGPDSPINAVAFVYIDEEQARQDLHELWLRGLECWTYIEGVETRIDADYAPPKPSRPW